MTNPPDRELAVFSTARQLPASERAAYLAEACAGDAALRQRIEELLQAGDAAGDFLKNPASIPIGPGGTVPMPATLVEKPGDQIGHYKLLQQIGEGGCGVVYMAEQEQPVRRRVALKVIKLGMDTKNVIARFEAERQALALMDHPNIAKVLDAGATNTGRPYFVMELVRGIKLTDYCDENNLSTRERLDLFIKVCQAVQHAHQKGVIHRDIKPSNILVTMSDGVPLPKVIDFGIAKATHGKLTDQTLFTAFEQFIGTPAYMSPEQAAMSAQDIDTRSDIYSLGVLLYELLTGQTPFNAEKLLRAGLDEIRRTIREEEPARPSTRLSTMLAGELTTAARHRQTEPPKLIHLVRGDLDWIVMKALEKNRARRYETANGFAADLQRHLNNEPVVACPPSNFYKLQKLVRRNKFLFTAGAAVLAALIIGFGVSSYLYIQEKRAGRIAAESERKAKSEATRSSQVAQFLKDMLQGVGPSAALGRDTKMLQEILASTETRISTELTNEPEVAVDLQNTIGNVYMDLGEYAKAESIDRKALALAKNQLGPENDSVVYSLFGIGDALRREKKYSEAETFIRESLILCKKLQGEKSKFMANELCLLGDVLRYEGKTAEAEPILRQALAMSQKLFGYESSETAESLNNLALTLQNQRQFAESEKMFRESIEIEKKLSPDENPDLANVLANLGEVLIDERKLAEADNVLRDSLRMYRRFYGDNRQAFVVGALFQLEDALLREDKYDECLTLLDEMLKQPNTTDIQLVRLLHARSTLYARRGQWREAIPDMAAALKLRPDSYSYYLGLGTLLAANGDLDAYQKHCQKYLAYYATNSSEENAYWIARTCVVVPCPGIDLQAVSKLADTALAFAETNNSSFLPGDQFLKAIVEYRLGHFESTVDYAQKSLKGKTDGSEDAMHIGSYYLMTMAHCRLNQHDEAKQAFLNTAGIQQNASSNSDKGPYWRFGVLIEGLRREATELIESDAKADLPK